MQTFLPYESFSESAKVLDYKRLGKQRVECKQIYMALTGKSKGWVNHPATKMWKGCERTLLMYAIVITSEWKHRGYKDSLLPFFLEEFQKQKNYERPSWLGNEQFHESHRSNLIRKNPEYYSEIWPNTPDNLPYLWP